MPKIDEFSWEELEHGTGGSGGSGADSQITTWSGRTQRDKNKDFVTVEDYGAIGDGVLHPLSEKYATLALAKSAYSNIANRITSLTQSIDWAAIQSALQANNTVYALAKRYVLTDTILVPDGHSLKGQGVDYWDSYRPNPTDLQKSDSNGTHFYFYGQGAKVHYIDDIANTLPPKSKDGVSYELTHFTNQDATATTSATPRMFSVGIKVGKNSNLEGCRAIPYYNGLRGYIDGTGLSDEWDVGVWVVSANDCQLDNVQSVGHWRMCGVLLTEHQGKSEGKRNPERCNFNRVWGSGVRGLIARNTPQYDCTAYTSSTLTLNVNNTETLSQVGKFRTSSSGIIYSFTGFTKSGNSLTLTGVSPSLTGLPITVRAWNAGNNFSNTVFNNCIFSSLDHVSGQPVESFGLPVSGAAEFDGYPMRNLVFINTTFQTTYDSLNTIVGNCYDFKFVACKHENGQVIAYNETETKMFTMNLRMIAQDALNAEHWTLFTPRSGFNDALQIPQTFTNGNLTLKPLPTKQVRIEDGAGSPFIETLVNGARRITFDDYLDIRKNVAESNGLTLTQTNTRVRNNLITDSTASFGGSIRPTQDNTTTLGVPAYRWLNVYAGTGTINTSDEQLKQQFRSQSESEKAAALEIKNSICLFKFNDAVDLKGDGARWHCGVKAQQVVSILESHGLNWQEYAFVCFDEWGEQAEIVDEEGVITQEHREAGSRYAIRYDELSMFILSSI